jgi:hypothetical protein
MVGTLGDRAFRVVSVLREHDYARLRVDFCATGVSEPVAMPVAMAKGLLFGPAGGRLGLCRCQDQG